MDGTALWSNKSRDRVNSALQHPDRALSVVQRLQICPNYCWDSQKSGTEGEVRETDARAASWGKESDLLRFGCPCAASSLQTNKDSPNAGVSSASLQDAPNWVFFSLQDGQM